MNWSDFSGKKVALAGAGIENLSLIPHLLKAGAAVTVCEQWKKELPVSLPKEVKIIFGAEHLTALNDFEVVFRAPGLPVERIKAVIKNDSIEITSVTDLFLAMKGSQTIGVTGTKGKGTTSTMIGGILRAAGRPVIIAGNIGRPVFDFIDEIKDDTIVVMELSSFQLEDIHHSPRMAVLLPITSDHLQPLSERSPNYHKDLPTYIAAKQQITAHQGPDDVVVFSLDSQASSQIGQSAVAKKISVSAITKADVFVENGVIHFDQESINLIKETKLRGDHLFHDAALAIAVGRNYQLATSDIIEGLRRYQPLPHRMESLGVFNGIEFVDDSYATAPDATVAALSAFTDKPVVIILGGSSKGADFSELAKAASGIKAAVLVGQEAGRIEAAFKEHAPGVNRVSGVSRFKDVVETAIHRAGPGDVVLLSPACASKDMFSDAAERGELFKKYVHELV